MPRGPARMPGPKQLPIEARVSLAFYEKLETRGGESSARFRYPFRKRAVISRACGRSRGPAGNRDRRMSDSMIRKLALAFVSIALTLLLLEGASRWFESINIVSGDPPEATREIPVRGESELRVHVYGGSTVWGLPFREVGFVAQLRDLLERSFQNHPTVVVNHGIQAGTSTNVVEKIAQTLSSSPSAIVVMTGHNEFLWPIDPSQVQLVDEIRGGLDKFALGRVMRQILRPTHERDRPE